MFKSLKISAVCARKGAHLIVLTERFWSLTNLFITDGEAADNIIEQYNKKDIHSFFITDVANDGMLSGLNMDTFQVVKKLTNKSITIGGGVKDIFDIKLSQKNGFDNVVVGKAIYENKISLESLIKFNA